MSSISRLKTSPGLLIRALVALGAVAAIAAALANLAAGRPALGADVAEELVVLVIVGALARRFGIALPGNGFTSYILGVMAYATLDRGWAFGVLVGPAAMLAGDVALRRLPSAAARDNAAHLAAGGAVAGLVYERLGGATGPRPSRRRICRRSSCFSCCSPASSTRRSTWSSRWGALSL